MANPQSQIIDIPLNAPLNFSQNDSAITHFNGFNSRNVPCISEMLSPIYEQEFAEKGMIDDNGNSWESIDAGNGQAWILRNGEKVHEVKKYAIEVSNVPDSLPDCQPLFFHSFGSGYILIKGDDYRLKVITTDGTNRTYTLEDINKTVFAGASVWREYLFILTTKKIIIRKFSNNALTEYAEFTHNRLLLGGDYYTFRAFCTNDLSSFNWVDKIIFSFNKVGVVNQEEMVDYVYYVDITNNTSNTIGTIKLAKKRNGIPEFLDDCILFNFDDRKICTNKMQNNTNYFYFRMDGYVEEDIEDRTQNPPVVTHYQYIKVESIENLNKVSTEKCFEFYSDYSRIIATGRPSVNGAALTFDTTMQMESTGIDREQWRYEVGLKNNGAPTDNVKISKGKFNILYDNQFLSTISVQEDNTKPATLLLPFSSLPDNQLPEPVLVGEELFYFDKDFNWGKVSINYSMLPQLNFLLGGIVIGTQCDNYINNDIIYTLGSDLNMNLKHGLRAPTQNTFKNLIVYSINPFFEISQKPVMSYQPTPIILKYGMQIDLTGQERNPEEICLFNSNSNADTTPYYRQSAKDGAVFVNNQYNGLPYPSLANILMPFTIFSFDFYVLLSQFFVKIGDEIFRPIVYDDKPLLAYLPNQPYESNKSGGAVGFILYGLPYIITNNKIYRYGAELQDASRTYIADVSGLQFVGANSTTAFFFSDLTKKIYSFTGSNAFAEVMDASKIKRILVTGYDQPRSLIGFSEPDRNYFIFNTSDFFGGTEKNISKIDFNYDEIILYKTGEKNKKIVFFEKNNFTKKNVKLSTMYYGFGQNTLQRCDCLYLRLFSEKNEKGIVKINSKTITNIGRKALLHSQEFKITSTDWDELTHTAYLRYQPKYQECVAISFEIESDFAISYMGVGTTNLGITQIGGKNADTAY